jgi:hypothetical protein
MIENILSVILRIVSRLKSVLSANMHNVFSGFIVVSSKTLLRLVFTDVINKKTLDCSFIASEPFIGIIQKSTVASSRKPKGS